ncbi:MAG: DUF484 family protein [Betaproteobacteria bacterium]
MSEPESQGEQVAAYLSDHPDFFEQRPELLASMRFAPAHGNRAISLHERQLDVLRDKLRHIERRFGELVHTGKENDAIGERLQRWTRDLLLAESPERVPGIVVDGMRSGFSVPLVALRLWRVKPGVLSPEWTRSTPAEWIDQVDAMRMPYCGPRGDLRFAGWLPNAGADARSLALLPMRHGVSPISFGLLVLGSGDADRFHSGMGVSFLERIAELASAALGRLAEPS